MNTTIGGPCLHCGRPNIEHANGVCPPQMLVASRPYARAMRPTESLRFVERARDNGDGTASHVRVLQQGWVDIHGGHIEWRDVPLVVES